MTLIEEAEKELILVSPYVNIGTWDKMKKCLERAVNRGVKITFIARKNATQDLSFLQNLKIKLILINDLHAKVYINDNCGVVTSQNIVHYSDINSIDIAHQTENNAERSELIAFVEKYIINALPINKTIIEPVKIHDLVNKNQLDELQVGKMFYVFMDEFKKSSFKKTASYVFSDDLLPFADVMLFNRYVIKISKRRTDVDLILKKFEEINFTYSHSFKIELLTSHNSFYYLDFIALGNIKLDKLIQDYISITESILQGGVMKILKPQKKNMWQ